MYRIIIALCAAFTLISCESCSAPQRAGNVAVGTFKCAVEYPVDTILQAASLAEKLRSDAGFIEAIVQWAQESKDSKFATCVLGVIARNLEKEQAPAQPALFNTPTVADSANQAYERFRREKFGDLKFELPPPN